MIEAEPITDKVDCLIEQRVDFEQPGRNTGDFRRGLKLGGAALNFLHEPQLLELSCYFFGHVLQDLQLLFGPLVRALWHHVKFADHFAPERDRSFDGLSVFTGLEVLFAVGSPVFLPLDSAGVNKQLPGLRGLSPIQCIDLPQSPLGFFEQSGVFDGDRGLTGKQLHQLNVVFAEHSIGHSLHCQRADRLTPTDQWHTEACLEFSEEGVHSWAKVGG